MRGSDMRAWMIGVLVAGCATKGPAPAPAPAVLDNDALLALAPAGTRFALVASPKALALTEAAVIRVQALLPAGSDFDEVRAQLEDARRALLGSAHSVEAAGFTTSRGLAVFEVADDRDLTIWPVADRDRFLAAHEGHTVAGGLDELTIAEEHVRCRATHGVYACAPDAALLDQLGTASLAGRPAAAGGRGDLEVIEDRTDPENGPPFTATFAVEPGALVARFRVHTSDPDLKVLRAPRAIGATQASGFFAFEASLDELADEIPDDGSLAAAALRAFAGRLSLIVPSGAADADLRVWFRTADVPRDVIARCDELNQLGLGVARGTPGACAIEPQLPFGALPAFTAWVDDRTLRISRERGHVDPASGPPPTSAGRELATAPWALTLWGRGDPFDPHGFTPSVRALFAQVAGGAWPDAAALVVRMVSYVTELGFGFRVEGDDVVGIAVVRTLFANPPEVVDALEPLVERLARGEDVSGAVKALAAAHPGSPLAEDVAAGPHGLRVPLAFIALVASNAARGAEQESDDDGD